MAQGNTCASSTDRAIRGRGWSEPTNIRASAREFALATPSDGFVARKNEPGGVDQRGEFACSPNESYRRLSVTKGVIRHVVRAVDSRIDLPMYAPSPLDNVITIDDERIKRHLDRVVRGSVEETLNALRDAEADWLCHAQRYERSVDRRDPNATCRPRPARYS
jgi:hypothetical protein